MALTRAQALDCFASDDLIGLGMEADALRRTLHPEARVTYAIERTLPWPADAAGATALDASLQDALDMGASAVRFAPDSPTHDLQWFEALLSAVKSRFPGLALFAFTPADLDRFSRASALDRTTVLARLRDAGLDGLLRSNDLQTHRAAHPFGLSRTAVLPFSGDPATFVEEIFALRDFQQETGALTALRPTASAAANPTEAPTAVETLKAIAISRLVLDNVPHIAAHAPSQGLKVLQMALRFGANDAGVLPLPERRPLVHKATALTEEELRRTIRDAGFEPAERDPGFTTWFLT
jgi:cyclic dehypoxanthinyl futalosine synthase